MKIFEKIKQARQDLGLTQSDMAKALGLSQNAVSKLESGQKKFIPNRYISFLHEKGYDINSIFSNNLPLRKLTGESAIANVGSESNVLLKHKMMQFLGLNSETSLNQFLEDVTETNGKAHHPLENLLLLAWEKKYLSKFNSLVRHMEINEEELFEDAPSRIAEAIRSLEDTDENQGIA